MEHPERLAVAVIAFVVGWGASAWIMSRVMWANRNTESKPNKDEPAPSENEMAWHIVHIRDDVGSLCGLVSICNGLIAAILGVLVIM